jgi:hypothetical protein
MFRDMFVVSWFTVCFTICLSFRGSRCGSRYVSRYVSHDMSLTRRHFGTISEHVSRYSYSRHREYQSPRARLMGRHRLEGEAREGICLPCWDPLSGRRHGEQSVELATSFVRKRGGTLLLISPALPCPSCPPSCPSSPQWAILLRRWRGGGMLRGCTISRC